LGKTLGQATRSFKVAAQEFQNEIQREANAEAASHQEGVASQKKEFGSAVTGEITPESSKQ
jgi:Sec-independent protein translocase protein TatA